MRASEILSDRHLFLSGRHLFLSGRHFPLFGPGLSFCQADTFFRPAHLPCFALCLLPFPFVSGSPTLAVSIISQPGTFWGSAARGRFCFRGYLKSRVLFGAPKQHGTQKRSGAILLPTLSPLAGVAATSSLSTSKCEILARGFWHAC